MTDITELAQREKFEAWAMTKICISKSTLEGLRTAEGYRNTTLSGTDYNRMWAAWKAAGAELVEALERAQQRISELEQQNSIANEKVTELSRLVQHNISRAEDAERRAERISKSSSLSHPGLLHATNELVLIFSHALADKLYAAQEKYNHGTSWRNNDWQEACQRDFQKHIAKGDPRDVAAYCAFMWWHGWSTKPAEELEPRTVTVKLPEPFKLAKSSSGLMYYFANEVNESLTAAGIKVEAE